jgi:predicted RNA-binding protein with PIN domain
LSGSTFIIDGYNALRALLPAVEIGASPEAARRAFEARLRAFRGASPGTRLIIVYDGEAGLPRAAGSEKGFEVRFAKPPHTADDLVLDIARRLDGSPGVHVVTSDFFDIGSRLAALRVRHLSSQSFADLVRKKLAARRPAAGGAGLEPGEKPAQVTAEETGDWLRRFGFAEEGEGDGRGP